jgi:hypothetical protein
VSTDFVPEKSLFEIWSKSIPRLPKNRFNSFCTWAGALLGLMPFVFGPIHSFWSTLGPFADVLVQVEASLLGFIIAGYAVFASTSNPKFFVAMLEMQDGTGLNLLQLHFVNFIRTFLHVFMGLIFAIGLSLATRFAPLVMSQVSVSDRLIPWVQATVLVGLGLAITATLVQLKSLIYNLYDLTITHVRFAKVIQDSEADAMANSSNLSQLPRPK